MKKLFLAATVLFAASAAFAGDSDQLKAILKAKTFAEAQQLIGQNLSQLANAQEKAKAYNHLTKLALEKVDKENAIQADNVQAKLMKQEEQAYDTVGFYNAAYDATLAAVECQKYDNEPNAKGKVAPKFIGSLTAPVGNARMQLVNAGNACAQRNDQDGVLKYWGTFLDTDDNPMFQATKESEKSFLGQVAFFTAQYANQAQQYEKAEKYIDIAIQDSAMHDNALTYKLAMGQRNLKTKEDSVAYVGKLKAMYEKDNTNETIFNSLASMYSTMNMTTELDAIIKEKLAADPNNFSALALKGQMELNKNSKEQAPDWDPCISYFKKAVAIDNSNVVVLTYLGFAINAKASQSLGTPDSKKELYKEAAGYLEHARDLDPNREKANWAYPLYSDYYQIYGEADPKTQELANILKN